MTRYHTAASSDWVYRWRDPESRIGRLRARLRPAIVRRAMARAR